VVVIDTTSPVVLVTSTFFLTRAVGLILAIWAGAVASRWATVIRDGMRVVASEMTRVVASDWA